jgi:hypothetical protein
VNEEEKQRIIQETLMHIKTWEQNMTVTGGSYKNTQHKDYSLLEIQLTDGSVVGMTISAGPTIGQHLVKEMGNGGWLYAFNDSESLIIKADRVVAVKLTKLTT